MQEKPGAQQDNVLYYLTPETITLVPQKENGAAPAAERHALRGEASPFPNTNIPQTTQEVKTAAAGARHPFLAALEEDIREDGKAAPEDFGGENDPFLEGFLADLRPDEAEGRLRAPAEDAVSDPNRLESPWENGNIITVKEFSRAAGLRTENERTRAAGFGRGQAAAAVAQHKRVEKLANSMYDIGSTEKNVDAWLRDKPIRQKIGSDKYPLKLHKGRQNGHIPGTNEYKQYTAKLAKKNQFGPSRLTIDMAAIEELVSRYHGTGILLKSDDGSWREIERITIHPGEIGIAVNNLTGAEASTTTFTIRYSKDGYHIVPDYPSRKGDKAKK